MKTAAIVSLVSAALCVAARAVGGGNLGTDPNCVDPPCGSANDVLYIYGSYGAVVFGLLARGSYA